MTGTEGPRLIRKRPTYRAGCGIAYGDQRSGLGAATPAEAVAPVGGWADSWEGEGTGDGGSCVPLEGVRGPGDHASVAVERVAEVPASRWVAPPVQPASSRNAKLVAIRRCGTVPPRSAARTPLRGGSFGG